MKLATKKEPTAKIKPLLKTPISYYGGKQTLLPEILPRIEAARPFKVYTESFFGGGAVYWALPAAEIEIINDVNREAINFYRQLKLNFAELQRLIDTTLHSRDLYEDAKFIYARPHLFSEVWRAWAFWVATNHGFLCQIGSWGFANDGKFTNKNNNAKLRFTDELAQRLERTQIECNDACRVITLRDCPEAFHYVDPPYVNSNQGHYEGYLLTDFERLLTTLQGVQGKFLLSTYPNELLAEFTAKNGWYTVNIDKPLSAGKSAGKERKRKVEVLTANYPI